MTYGYGTYLVGKDECAEEDTLIGPLLEGDLDMGLCTLDVDEGDEEGGDLDLCLGEDVGDELEELGVFRVAGHGAATGRGGGAAQSIVDGLSDRVDKVFYAREGG